MVEDAALGSDPWHVWIHSQRDGGDPEFARTLGMRIDEIRDAVIAAAHLRPGMKVADIGAGDGLLGLAVLASADASIEVTFIEPSPGLLADIRALTEKQGVAARCRFVAARIEALSEIADASFDVVLLRAVLAYVPDKLAAMQAFFRILKPGGRLSLADPLLRERALAVTRIARGLESASFGERTAEMELIHRWLSRQFPDTLEAITSNCLTNYTERELVRFAQAAGFLPIHGRAELDVRPANPLAWETFLRLSPFAGVPTLAEILERDFDAAERSEFERYIRPAVERGGSGEESATAFLVAEKPQFGTMTAAGARRSERGMGAP
jgi:ubiquinone/menaquinone biosynthesis C-methylase UbiE